jgi:ABC-type phosphate transport system substrate-binding protein
MAVDLSRSSPTRKAFTESIHRRPVGAVVAYWRQQIFSGGDLPPAEKERDSDVLELVRTTPDAIGYVSAGTRLGPGLRALQIRR